MRRATPTYALYGFIGPLLAFVLLAAISVFALAYSSIHGPAFAAMGLVGSYVTPLLISSTQPNAWSLFLYLGFITFACFFTAQIRSWLWLAVTALAASILWGFLWIGTHWQQGDIYALGAYILALLALSLFFLKQEEPKTFFANPDHTKNEPDKEPLWSSDTFADWPVILGMTGIVFLAAVVLRQSSYADLSWLLFAVSIGGLLCCAWMWRSMTMLAPLAATLFLFAYGTWHFGWLVERVPSIDFLTPPALTQFLVFGASFAGAFALLGFFGVLRRNGDPVWALTSGVTALLTYIYATWRATSFEHSLPFGFSGLALAGAATLATDWIDRSYKNRGPKNRGPKNRRPKNRRYEVSAGIYATVAVTALALALTILLEKGWLTIALAAITPALAFIARARKMQALGWLAAGIAVIVAARLVWDPQIIGDDLGKTPIFNWLLYGYGVPAVTLALAASIIRKQRDDWVPAFLEAAAILFSTVLVFFEIRHFMNDGNIFAVRYSLPELSLHTALFLTLSLGYQFVHERSNRWMPEAASIVLGLLSIPPMLIGHLLIKNPIFTNDSVGTGLIFNDLVLAYALPAFICAVIYMRAKNTRPALYTYMFGAAAAVLVFTWITLTVRTYFQGGMLGLSQHTSDAEWYSYSAVWLTFGLLGLLSGIKFASQTLRKGAMGLVGLVILKVFLSDMSHLTGLYRALSFIGLGLALVGIGALYQRIIFPPKPIEQKENEKVDK